MPCRLTQSPTIPTALSDISISTATSSGPRTHAYVVVLIIEMRDSGDVFNEYVLSANSPSVSAADCADNVIFVTHNVTSWLPTMQMSWLQPTHHSPVPEAQHIYILIMLQNHRILSTTCSAAEPHNASVTETQPLTPIYF